MKNPPTLTTIEARIAEIKRIGAEDPDDPESAHGLEDDLHQDVLRAISLGLIDPAPAAALALTTLDLPFARWCA